jgi:putative ABC transport system permease protein
MLKNLFITALRNVRKNRVYFLINVFGLTVGLTSCLLIALFIRHELSYDAFEVNGTRIARVIMEYKFDGGKVWTKANYTSTKVAPAMVRNFPEVVSAVRMFNPDRVVGYGEKLFTEKHFMYADSSFFDLFNVPLVEGDAHTALSGDRKIILSESVVRKYFDRENPMGKTLRVGSDSTPYVVTGVMQDYPSNSQFRPELLASFSSMGVIQEMTYWEANYTTYLLLKEEGSIARLQAKLPAFMKKEMAGEGASINFYLEPFNRIHLYSPYDAFEPNTSISYIYVLAGVALLMLIIACSSYINLSTARSVERAREVGVRKVIGAGKGQLFWQFIGESTLVCFTAVLISMLVTGLTLPAFNRLTGRELHLSELISVPFILFSLLTGLVVSLLAGIYPAVILTGFQPVKVLKGAFTNTRSGKGLRQSLIVFQFVISVFLIVSTIIMQRQLYFIQHKKLGYNRDHVLVLPMTGKMTRDIKTIKSEFGRVPHVMSISHCVSTPVSIAGGYNMRSAVMSANQQMNVTANPIDEDFLRTTGLQLVAGQDLTEQDIKDSHPMTPAGELDEKAPRIFHFILNESAARVLGWSPQEAIGKLMYMGGTRPGYVKGVVKDFHFKSLHEAIQPLVLFPSDRGSHLLVKVSGDKYQETVAALQDKWKALVPYLPFEYKFLDEEYERMYASEQRLGTVMNLFSVIAIVLACLGLLGLSAFAAKQRIKEIGVRKVLGASLTDMVLLLSGSFIKLALIAIVIGLPLSWWAMHRWLQDFAYQADTTFWIYPAGALIVMTITVTTVSIQALRAASVNPVKSLRSD